MRKELCRNFQRGSCRYGEKCRFLHPNQQQSNDKSNAFGFGAQNGVSQQQKSNPFGFGVQNNSQPTGFNNNAFGSNQNQFKPFANKWTRDGASSTQPTGNQSKPAAEHICTDPASCKRIIEEDFKSEKPIWKLTCYGHFKHLPCDIVGDVSLEELRASAYDEAKRGVNLQSIVERERNLLNSKLVEIDNFLRSPYKGPANSIPANQNAVPAVSTNQFSLTGQNTTPSNSFLPTGQNNATPNSSFPGFGQPAAPLNSGFGPSLSPQMNSSFGQPNSFSNFNQPSKAFGVNSSPSGGAGSGFQTNPPAFGTNPPAFGTNPPAFGTNPPAFGTNPPAFGTNPPALGTNPPAFVNPFNSNTTGTGNSGLNTPQTNQFPTSASSFLNPDTTKTQIQTGFPVPSSSPSSAGQVITDAQLGTNPQKEAASVDPSIWLKEKWNPGEIPEQPPPDAYI